MLFNFITTITFRLQNQFHDYNSFFFRSHAVSVYGEQELLFLFCSPVPDVLHLFLLNYFFTVPTKHVWYNSRKRLRKIYCYVQNITNFFAGEWVRRGTEIPEPHQGKERVLHIYEERRRIQS